MNDISIIRTIFDGGCLIRCTCLYSIPNSRIPSIPCIFSIGKKRKLVIRSDLGEASENLNYRPICHSQLVDSCVAIYRPLATIESIWLLLSEEQKIIKLLFLLPLFLLHF